MIQSVILIVKYSFGGVGEGGGKGKGPEVFGLSSRVFTLT
jgi:hypothetical protein